MPGFLEGSAEAVLMCSLPWAAVVVGSLGFHVGNACEPFWKGSAEQPAVSWW